MRSEFRFPKATPVLMMVILAGVVMAIEMATTISPGLPPKFTILSDLVLALVGGLLVGAIGWAVLFALRRSGVHRLEELRPQGKASSGGSLMG